MHNSVMKWVGEMVAEFRLSKCSVLEVGSYDVNGSVRKFFQANYTGIDIRPGPGVDQIVEMGGRYPFPDGEFDLVISTEMLEHDLTPWISMVEMARVLVRKYGVLMLTARGYDQRGCFPVHDYPGDYWRYSCGGLQALAMSAGLEVVDCRPDPQDPGVFLMARKP